MSTNCYFSKINEAVVNDSLPILATIRVTFPTAVSYNDAYASIRWLQDTTPEELKWQNGSEVPISVNPLSYSATVTTKVAIDDTLLFKDKINLERVLFRYGNGKINLEDLSGTSLKILELGPGNNGDTVSMIPKSVLRNLERILVGGLRGDMSEFAEATELTNFGYSKGNILPIATNITGSLSSISNLTKLITLNVPAGVTGNLSMLGCGDTLVTFDCENPSDNYIDNDASLWANTFKTLQSATSWNSRLIWNSTSLRSSAYPVINAQVGFASATDCDNFLINMATCLDNGLYTQTNKNMYFQGGATRTSASDNAVNKFVAAGWTINGVTKV